MNTNKIIQTDIWKYKYKYEWIQQKKVYAYEYKCYKRMQIYIQTCHKIWFMDWIKKY